MIKDTLKESEVKWGIGNNILSNKYMHIIQWDVAHFVVYITSLTLTLVLIKFKVKT